MSIVTSFRSEILKSKRTAALYLTIFAAAFGPLMSMLDLLMDGIGDEHRKTILNELFTKKFQMTALVAFPIFLILVCTLLPQIEYKNNTWKQVLTSPQTKWNVFAAKFINIQFLILVFLLTNQLLMFVNAVILHFMDPSLNIFSQPLNASDAVMSKVNTYTALLAVCCIQFWLGLKFKNFIIPIGIGIALWFIGTIFVMQNMDFAAYFPYSYHAYGSFPKYNPQFNDAAFTSLIYAVVFLGIAFADFRKRRMAS